MFVAFDRDGTLVHYVPYLARIEQLRLVDGAVDAVRALNQMGIPAIVITNQSVVGRKVITQADLDLIHEHLCLLFEKDGASIDRVFVCPHLPEDFCSCRKPELDLLTQAASYLNVPVSEAVVIGDNAADIDLAFRAGVLGLHVKSGVGYAPTITVPSFTGPLEAVNWLLSSSPLQRRRLIDETYEG